MGKPAKLASEKPVLQIKKKELCFMKICCPKATQKQF